MKNGDKVKVLKAINNLRVGDVVEVVDLGDGRVLLLRDGCSTWVDKAAVELVKK